MHPSRAIRPLLASSLLLAALCLPGRPTAQAQQSPGATACPRTKLVDFEFSRAGDDPRTIPIWQLPSNSAIFFVAGMAIDADGAPNAYNPQDTGIDDLGNAGEPGNWNALAKDDDGQPLVQGPDDPYPGYYISTTALSDRSKPAKDPSRYVDATKIPYVVLPVGLNRQYGVRPGDFAFVANQRNGKTSFAIFADVGPPNAIGEGSIALAENVGVRSSPRRGGIRDGILYVVFTGSGNRQPRPIDEINSEGARLLREIGGLERLQTCSAPASAPEQR